jgi:hypothetical protein
MAWTTAVSDLRLILSDGDTDKMRAYKRVFGQIDGTNATFKSFEFRRVTDFSSPATDSGPLGVYVSGVKVLSSDVVSDDPGTGFFTLATAPVVGDVVECTYFIRYFLDTEIDGFLRLAQNWLIGANDFSSTPEGLRPCLLQYAAGEAYQKLAMRFSEHMSETYRLEDMPDVKRTALVAEYKAAASEAKDQATKLRNEYYSRQGQHLAPLFGTFSPNIRDVGPRR